MKKIIFMLCAIILIAACGYTYCFAEEVETTVPSAEQDTVPVEPSEEALGGVSEDGGAHHTLLARIWEYVVTYKAEIIAVAGDAIIFIGVLILRSIFKKKTTDISSDLKLVKGDASGTRSQQVLVTDAINGLIGGYNEMRASYDKYETVEDDRNRLVAALAIQNTAILEILRTVYVNSKNLPQGVKDVVTLEYANVLKSLDNDETLRSVVEAVRDKVNASAETSQTSEDAV